MQDAIDLSTAGVVGGADVRGWPKTTEITSLATGQNGIEVQFSKRSGTDWPDIVPAGWDGPVYFTVWLGKPLPDGIHLAASLNVYRGQPGSGAGDVTDFAIRVNPNFAPGQYSQNLWYLDPALAKHSAVEGETLYLMVTAGGLRGASAVSVQERSNIVAFTASSSPRTFTFDQQTPPIDPPVDPPVDPKPTTPCDLTPILARLDAMESAIKAHDDANTEKVKQQINQVVKQMEESLKALAPFTRILKR